MGRRCGPQATGIKASGMTTDEKGQGIKQSVTFITD
jgi:hypothetical protein